MARLVGLEVFKERVVVLQSHLGGFAVFVRFFEERLEGVIAEEVGLDEVFEVITAHILSAYTLGSI